MSTNAAPKIAPETETPDDGTPPIDNGPVEQGLVDRAEAHARLAEASVAQTEARIHVLGAAIASLRAVAVQAGIEVSDYTQPPAEQPQQVVETMQGSPSHDAAAKQAARSLGEMQAIVLEEFRQGLNDGLNRPEPHESLQAVVIGAVRDAMVAPAT